MPILDLCEKNPIFIDQGASLTYAAQLMKGNHVGSLVVVATDGHKKPVGILTDRDIVLNMVAETKSPFTRVEEVMSKNLITVTTDFGIAEAIDLMDREKIRRIVVVDENENACGIVSTDDVLKLVARELDGLGRIFSTQVENEKRFKPSERMLSS